LKLKDCCPNPTKIDNEPEAHHQYWLSIVMAANNPEQSWGFEGEPSEAVMKDLGILVPEMGLHEDASFNCI
jgi:hypothetical protein